MKKKILILILFPDVSQVEEHPTMLLSASTPLGKPPQNLCAVLTNCANSMNKRLLSIDEAQRSITFTHNGFNEHWRLCGMVVEVSLDSTRFRVFGLLTLDAVQSRRLSVKPK
ncbi:hypothetical protein AB4254_10810 [Vibrio breoganii]